MGKHREPKVKIDAKGMSIDSRSGTGRSVASMIRKYGKSIFFPDAQRGAEGTGRDARRPWM